MTTAMMTIHLVMHATLLMYNYLFSPICGSMNAYSLQLVGCSLRNDYPNLFNGESGRTKRALEAAQPRRERFFPSCDPICGKTRLLIQTTNWTSLDERVEGQHAKQVARKQKHTEFKIK
ncbi:hypothetical protein GQ600_25778 [Phytophthora cactorum]|nr:hypothetical protein GQ600_25778 [Phytophthora cactorum]